MGLHSSFEVLSKMLEEFNRNNQSVHRVAVTGEQHGPVSATVKTRASVSDFLNGDSLLSVSSSTASIDDTGPIVTFRLEDLSSTLLPDVPESSYDCVTDISISLDGIEICDGELIIELSLVIEDVGRNHSDDKNTTESYAVAPRVSEETSEIERDVAKCKNEGIGQALDTVRNESIPAFEDTAYLRQLYELGKTFDQMSDLIQMDVSAETVRRYMIDAGIHSPNSNAKPDQSKISEAPEDSLGEYIKPVQSSQTLFKQDSDGSSSPRANKIQPGPVSSDSNPGEPFPTTDLLTDGVGLPDDVTLNDFAKIIIESRTVHEVHHQLGINHERTRELLRQLNVLDLVVTRASAAKKQDVTLETVAERIREST